MDENLIKILSDGTKIPINVYRAFTNSVDLFEEGVYTVSTTCIEPVGLCELRYYVTTVIEREKNGERLRAFRSVTESE